MESSPDHVLRAIIKLLPTSDIISLSSTCSCLRRKCFQLYDYLPITVNEDDLSLKNKQKTLNRLLHRYPNSFSKLVWNEGKSREDYFSKITKLNNTRISSVHVCVPTYSDDAGDSFFKSIAGLSNLTHLTVAGNWNVSHTRISEIFNSVHRLQSVRFIVSEEAFFTVLPSSAIFHLLSNHWSSLRCLEVHGIETLPEKCVKELSKCHDLEYLYFRNSRPLGNRVLQTISSFRRLRTLHIICQATSKSSLHRMLDSAEWRIIRELTLQYATELDDTIAELISNKFPDLTLLDISGSARITDNGLGHLSRACCQMETFYVNHCPRITDQGLSTIIGKWTALKFVDAMGCSGVTGEFLSSRGASGDCHLTVLLSKCDPSLAQEITSHPKSNITISAGRMRYTSTTS